MKRTKLLIAIAAHVSMATITDSAFAQLHLKEPNPVDQEQLQPHVAKKDSNAKFLVYTGSSGEIIGLKFYEFDQVNRDYKQANDHCKAKGLSLMTLSEADSLERELKTDKSKRQEWLGKKTNSWVWTSSFDINDPDRARGFIADIFNAAITDYYRLNDNYRGTPVRDYNVVVRCVGR